MSQIYLMNAYIVTMAEDRKVYERAGLLVEDDRIARVGDIRLADLRADAEIIDCSGKFILPGLINTHVHTTQQLGRGLADDVDLLVWLRERIWPYESSMTVEDQQVSALACCAEMIKSGVTSFAEAGGFHVDAIGSAVSQAGLRCALTRSTMDAGLGLPKVWVESTDETLAIQAEAYAKWHGSAEGRIQYWFGIRTIFNATDDLLLKTKEIADRLGTGINMHISEVPEENDFVKEKTGGFSTVEHLARIGFLGSNLLGAHTVWLTDREIDLFRLYDVKSSHNPASAMRVLGFARVPEMLKKGITVSIGTDGAPTNNRMDMFDEMYVTALIHKGRTLNPKTTPAETVLEMATLHGAKSILREKEIGSLTPGKKADLLILNPRNIGTIPVHDPISSIVYAMHSTSVESSMCDGKWLMKERVLQTINEEEILDEAAARAKAIYQRAGINLPDRFPTVR
jgi:5-methylthioadenosine/S-adenosylhomocysteine deaminase